MHRNHIRSISMQASLRHVDMWSRGRVPPKTYTQQTFLTATVATTNGQVSVRCLLTAVRKKTYLQAAVHWHSTSQLIAAWPAYRNELTTWLYEVPAAGPRQQMAAPAADDHHHNSTRCSTIETPTKQCHYLSLEDIESLSISHYLPSVQSTDIKWFRCLAA